MWSILPACTNIFPKSSIILLLAFIVLIYYCWLSLRLCHCIDDWCISLAQLWALSQIPIVRPVFCMIWKSFCILELLLTTDMGMFLVKFSIIGIELVGFFPMANLEAMGKKFFLQLLDTECTILVYTWRCNFESIHIFRSSNWSLIVWLLVSFTIMHRICWLHALLKDLHLLLLGQKLSCLIRHLFEHPLLVHCLDWVSQKVGFLVTFQLDECKLSRLLRACTIVCVLHGFDTGLLVSYSISRSFMVKIFRLNSR